MVTLEKLVSDLRKKKQEATKLKNKSEKKLQEYRSLERRSSAGLNTIEKKIESQKEDAFDLSETLTQKNAQIESIERLISAAKERLGIDKDAINQTEQELEFTDNPEEKVYAESRLRSLKDHVEELESEIKNRVKTAKKIADEIAQFSDIKSKINSKIQKQAHSKPPLREKMVSSHKEAAKLEKELEQRIKAEKLATNALEKAVKRLDEYLKKKKSIKKKPKRTAAKRKTTSKKPKRTAAKKRSRK